MAIDFIIGTLLLLSVLVNVLALCAFRVTPSLQTRSNSFVINLLVINVFSCIILAGFLIINTHYVRAVLHANYGFAENGEERRYFLDVVATLGALSLTLVICDTHSAITDPLRYHSRLSTLKVWLMIAAVWIVGIVFGVGSYFRGTSNVLFTALFCTLIIAAPFCLICAMYWRIFREARQNGLRMRQNGSSPLLQSALNLVSNQMTNQTSFHHHHQQRCWDAAQKPTIETILEKSPSLGEGLTLKIDENAPKVASSSLNLRADKNTMMVNGSDKRPAGTRSMANLSISRNQSLRQMFLFGVKDVDATGQSEEVEAEAAEPAADRLLNQLNNLVVRQVRSTPDLQSYLNPDDGLKVTSESGCEKTLLEYQFRSIVPSQTPPKHLGYMTSIRHRLSNASSLFKYREESRAARISILVVIMFLVSYIPYGLLLVAGDKGYLTHYTETVLSIFVVVLANIGSPIIFAYRNKRVRRAVKRLLHLETKELLPSSLYSSSSRRLYRQKTISVYKKNLVLKAGTGRRMQKLLLSYPLEKCEKDQRPQLTLKVVPLAKVQQQGYENYFDESVETKASEVNYGEQKRNSTTSTASTIPCEDALEQGGSEKTISLLNRFGFIRNQSRKVQKFGVSV